MDSAESNAIIAFPVGQGAQVGQMASVVPALPVGRSAQVALEQSLRRWRDALQAQLAALAATALVARQQLAAVDAAALAGVAPRLVPHAVVLGLALLVVAVGGFARPDLGVSVPISTEQGHLTAYSRLLLGPRAGEVQVRDAFVNPALSTTALTPGQPRADTSTYVVQPGDTVWDIGARFNVGAYSVLWSNGLDEDDIIKPGQELKVPPVPGTLHVVGASDSLDSVAKKYNVDPAVIVDFNGLRPGEALTPDKLLVIPGGSLPFLPRPVVPRVTAPQPPRPAPQPAQPARPGTTTQPQARPAPIPVVPPAPVAPTGRLSWPTRGVITTYFSSWHPGLDIAAPLGTYIGAADGGTVTFAGWDNTGYGYRVIVNHGNGYSTTYNHLSVISVRVGQSVGKGGQIGLMGSTGRSTGPHLHFEILRNGSYLNPLGVLN